MDQSPVEQLLAAIDSRDLDAAVALFAPDGRLLAADGRRVGGRDAVGELVRSFLGDLRSSSHQITAQWHIDDVWIAELEASYVLTDWLQMNAVPRAMVLREGPDGVTEVNFYGAHELPLTDHRAPDQGTWFGARYIPPL
jgi:SnoaL-like domain